MFQPDKLKELIGSHKAAAPTFAPDLTGLIGWLETHYGSSEYDWNNIHGCLVCKFLVAIGKRDTPLTLQEVFGRLDGEHYWVSSKAYHAIAGTHPWTFGAALLRARAYRDSVSA